MKNLMTILAVLALLVTLLPGAALAQDPVYEEETVFDFEADVVEGQLVRPDGENIMGQRGRDAASLIRIRPDFIPEMVRSVEEL